MRSKLLFGLAIVAMFVMSGCATQGDAVKIPLTMPGGEKATIVAHNQSTPDWMLDRDTLKVNYLVKGDVTAKQLAAVAETERACRIYTGVVRPNELVAVLLNGILYGVVTAPFGGLGSQAFAGAKFGEYAKYVGVVSAGGGIANGVIQSGGKTYTFENCGREVLGLFPGYEVKVLQKSPY